MFLSSGALSAVTPSDPSELCGSDDEALCGALAGGTATGMETTHESS